MYLYGASGHAKVIIDILKANGLDVECLFDDNKAINSLSGKTVRHDYQGEGPVIFSIGSNKVRKLLDEKWQADYATAIHPSAIISPTATVDKGSVVMQGAVIQTEATIGKHCIINTGATIDHECRIGDYVHVSPNATICGDSEVGEGTWIGAGSTVIQCVKIGKWCVVGAGSVVIHDLPDGVLAVGNPARIIRKL